MNRVKPTEHVLIAGRTGSGKTVLARIYLAGFKNVVVLDTKGLFKWPEIPGTKWGGDDQEILIDGNKQLTLVSHLADLGKVKTSKVIYRPVFSEMNQEFYNAFYRWAYFRRNTIVYTDELMSVCKNAQTYPEYLGAIMTRGRELKVAHWGATQRPANIAIITISEATHFFVFDLNMKADRERLTELSGCQEFNQRVSLKHGAFSFWYYNVGNDIAVPARLKL